MPAPVASRVFDPHATEAWLARTPPGPAPWLHEEVGRRMAQRLSFVKRRPATVVDWWASLGGATALLREQYPDARVIEVEAEPRLVRLRETQGSAPWWSPRRWRRESAPTPVTEHDAQTLGADLLWANMVLHWAPDPEAQFGSWHRALAIDGFLMFSCLGPDTVRELRALYERQGWGPPGAEFVDMHDLGDMLVHAGFDDPVMDMETVRLSWDDPARCLAELRTLGRNAHPGRAPGCRTPRWRRRLLEALAPAGAAVGITFEIVYGHAFKGLPRSRGGTTTEVSLADMRAMVRGRKAAP